jgi:branched-chain amino acid transport system permease protein
VDAVTIVVQLLIVGIMVGTLYGLIGSTLTLMFRSTGILSFAHAGFALTGAYLYSGFSCPSSTGTECGEPTFPHPWIAAGVCIAVTTVAGLVVERLVIRPLQGSDIIRKSIATAAVLGLASGIMLQIYGPQPRGVPQDQELFPSGAFTIQGVVVDNQRLGILIVSASVMLLIAAVLSRSWFGLGVRAAGQRPDVVQLFGVKPATTSRFNWALGGALAGLAGVLIAPVSVVNIGTFSFLLAKGVAAALLGGLVSLPLTFAGGLLLGAVEALTPYYFEQTGSATVGIAAVTLLSVGINRRKIAQLAAVGGRSTAAPPGPARLRAAIAIAGASTVTRRVPRLVWFVAGLALLYYPLTSAYYGSIGLACVFWALLALSVLLPAGDAGQPTFVQIGFAGIAAYTAASLQQKDMPFGWAALIGIGAALVAGLVVGALTLRFRGAAFAILSLTFGAMISDYVLNLNFMRTSAGNPTFFGVDLLVSNYAFAIALGLFAVATLLVFNFRRSALGVSFRTLRSGTNLLSTFGVNATRLELVVFTLSAGIAGAAGVTYGLLVSSFTTFQFIPLVGVIVLLAAFVGGLRSLLGPVIAGLIFGYGPVLAANLSSADANAFPQIASSALALILVVAAPQGLASIGEWARESLVVAGSTTPSATFRGRKVSATPRSSDPVSASLRRPPENRVTVAEGLERPPAVPSRPPQRRLVTSGTRTSLGPYSEQSTTPTSSAQERK